MVTQVYRGQGAADTLTSPPIRTSTAQLLIAFLSSDGAAGSAPSFRGVSGCGLRWTRAVVANGQDGVSEVWQARVRRTLDGCTITGTRGFGSYSGAIAVAGYRGARGIGAVASSGGASGNPTVTLSTTGANSLVAAAGNDWYTAAERTVPAGQQLLAQYLAWLGTPSGPRHWWRHAHYPDR
jgi:hypothetical protein